MSYYDVVAHESELGTVTIVGTSDLKTRRRRTLRVFRAGCGAIEHAKDWLAKHAPRGHIWRHPDGSRVVVTRRVERTSDGRPVYVITGDHYAASHST